VFCRLRRVHHPVEWSGSTCQKLSHGDKLLADLTCTKLAVTECCLAWQWHTCRMCGCEWLITRLAEPLATQRSFAVVLSLVQSLTQLLNTLESCNWRLAAKLGGSGQVQRHVGQWQAKLLNKHSGTDKKLYSVRTCIVPLSPPRRITDSVSHVAEVVADWCDDMHIQCPSAAVGNVHRHSVSIVVVHVGIGAVTGEVSLNG
jgi:hypothetical protein